LDSQVVVETGPSSTPSNPVPIKRYRNALKYHLGEIANAINNVNYVESDDNYPL
jgi:hypothetical protein